MVTHVDAVLLIFVAKENSSKYDSLGGIKLFLKLAPYDVLKFSDIWYVWWY